MAENQSARKHPESDRRFRALEEQVKKLERQTRDLQQKMQTHDHPYSH